MPKMVRINDDTHEALTKLGSKNESYNDIIRRLIDAYKGKKWLYNVLCIFPNNEHPFSTNTPRLLDATSQEMTVWFGFIVEYAYHSNDIGEYGFIGEIHKWAYTGQEILKLFEPRRGE